MKVIASLKPNSTTGRLWRAEKRQGGTICGVKFERGIDGVYRTAELDAAESGELSASSMVETVLAPPPSTVADEPVQICPAPKSKTPPAPVEDAPAGPSRHGGLTKPSEEIPPNQRSTTNPARPVHFMKRGRKGKR